MLFVIYVVIIYSFRKLLKLLKLSCSFTSFQWVLNKPTYANILEQWLTHKDHSVHINHY